jgi:metal-responsive CopG/Arc/MetJ family transcriptional regulator
MNRSFNITLPENILAELEKISEQEGLTVNEVLSQALRDYIIVRKYGILRMRTIPYYNDELNYSDEDEDMIENVS